MDISRVSTVTGAYVFAVLVLLSGCSEPASLKSYSTEDIVAEYHRRLDGTLTGELDRISSRVDKALAASSSVPTSEALRDVGEVKHEAIKELLPFAQAGAPTAAWFVGSHLMATSGYGTERYNEGFEMLRTSGQKGTTEGAMGLSGYYLFCAMRNNPNSKPTLGLAYLWAKEAARTDNSLSRLLEPILYQLPMTEVKRLDTEWPMWSPKEEKNSPPCETILSQG